MKYSFIFLILLASTAFCKETIMIGIAGGSGSGKTTIARKIHEAFPEDSILICQDFYYKDLSHLTMEERDKVNFDHPNSIEFSLMNKHLLELRNHNSVSIPQYDFTIHARKKNLIDIAPKKIIIVEGLHLLAIPEIRSLFDLRLFIDTDPDIRLIRRITRDQTERERTLTSILSQYMDTVRPMYLEFIEPSKRYADVIIPEGGENQVAVEMVISKLDSFLEN